MCKDAIWAGALLSLFRRGVKGFAQRRHAGCPDCWLLLAVLFMLAIGTAKAKDDAARHDDPSLSRRTVEQLYEATSQDAETFEKARTMPEVRREVERVFKRKLSDEQLQAMARQGRAEAEYWRRYLQGLEQAAKAPKQAGAAQQRAILGLNANGLASGDTVVYLVGKDVLVPVKDLEKAGLKRFTGKQKKIGNRRFVSLASLAPGISYKIDEKKAVLRITAKPSYFATQVVSLQGVKPLAGIRYSHDTSLFINYSVDVNDFKQFSSFEEAGLSFSGKYLLYSSLFRNLDGTWARGLTNLTMDDRSALRRWTLGDEVAATPDPLGGSASIGGFGVSKDFTLDPYFIRFPQQSLQGTLTMPSTVEVFRNGTLVSKEQLAPGAFNLQNIPFGAGGGVTKVVIKNALGQQQELSTPYYLSTQTLKQGLSQYQYDIGLLRPTFGTTSFQYDGLAYQAYHVYGLTNWLTGGVRFEGMGVGRELSGGPVFALSTPLGAFGGSAAASRDGADAGYAANVTYAYLFNPFSVEIGAEAMSPRYTNLSLLASADRPLYEVSFTGGWALGPWVTFTPEYSFSRFRDAGPEQTAGLTFNFQLPFNSTLLVAASYTNERMLRNDVTISANLVFSFGGSTTASAIYDHQSGGQSGNGSRFGAQVERGVPLGPGYGYLVQAQSGQGQQEAVADLRYHGDYGSYEADFDRLNGQNTTDLTVSGGVVALGGRVFATRPVEGSYALLRTAGLPGVEATLSNQDMGKTDSKGGLLIPNLIPYFGNEIGINAEKLPIDYEVDTTKEIIAPPSRGGAVVDFPVRRVQAVLGRLVVVAEGRQIVPAFGELTVASPGRKLTSPIGKRGEFYLDSPPSGRHPASVEFEQGTCNFDIDVPKAEGLSVNLHVLRCVMGAGQQGHP